MCWDKFYQVGGFLNTVGSQSGLLSVSESLSLCIVS